MRSPTTRRAPRSLARVVRPAYYCVARLEIAQAPNVADVTSFHDASSHGADMWRYCLSCVRGGSTQAAYQIAVS